MRPLSAVTLLAAHGFSTVRSADLIVVIDGAAVAELGGHVDLLLNHGSGGAETRDAARTFARRGQHQKAGVVPRASCRRE